MDSWQLLSHNALLRLLRRAHDGENPDLLLAEVWANSDYEPAQGK